MILIFILLIIVAFALALHSMKDLNVPPEIAKLIRSKKVRGTIVFFKNKVHHYSSSSTSSSD
ncbi:hypothetical protein HGB07_04330 [Candidatus Roizmanbacteria bacterium]|nr:hypothetical protein [Candidatus Roizmanbacteria bacterium]